MQKTLQPEPAAGDSLQALTAAISPKGISSFFSEIPGLLVQQSFKAPDMPSIIQNVDIPVIPCSTTIVKLDLAGGSVTQLKASLNSINQKANGIFSVVLTASFSIAYSSWHETGSTFCPGGCPKCRGSNSPFDLTLGDFWFTISSINMGFDVQLAMSGSSWQVNITNPSQSNVNIGTVHVPSHSNLNDPSMFSCINNQINAQLAARIQGVQFAQQLQAVLSNLLKTIPVSGKLTSQITYQFPPNFINFPGDQGISAGITGQVLYNQTPYNGAAVVVPAAEVDVAHDLTMNVGVYEFNALLWAFDQSGFLNFTLTSQMLPDPKVLNTATYKILFPQLYNFAPNAFMNIGIAAQNAPQVTNGPVYWLTTDVLNSIQSKISATAYNELHGSNLLGAVYPNITVFDGALKSVLSPSDYTAYASLIEKASVAIGMFVATRLLLTVFVIVEDAQKFAFSFMVEKDDLLINYQLATIGSAQTIKFYFAEFNTTAAIVKTDIGTIDPDMLDLIWTIADVKIDDAIQEAGKAGVPLPFISGFLFQNSLIQLYDNYVNIATDVKFTTLNAHYKTNPRPGGHAALFNPKAVINLRKSLLSTSSFEKEVSELEHLS